jgi:ABC-type antimicrobial peptide transport system permease subunit
VAGLDPKLPLSSGRSLDRVLGDAMDRPRALMLLMSAFAALALALAALGIYSVVSFNVRQRRQEISVRIAVGAEPGDVQWLVVRQGLALASIGAAAGGLGAVALGRTLSSLLYGVSPADLTSFAAATAAALTTAAAACLFPARRASRLDPVSGLRAD